MPDELKFAAAIRRMSAIFTSTLASKASVKQREAHVVDVVMSYLAR